MERHERQSAYGSTGVSGCALSCCVLAMAYTIRNGHREVVPILWINALVLWNRRMLVYLLPAYVTLSRSGATAQPASVVHQLYGAGTQSQRLTLYYQSPSVLLVRSVNPTTDVIMDINPTSKIHVFGNGNEKRVARRSTKVSR